MLLPALFARRDVVMAQWAPSQHRDSQRYEEDLTRERHCRLEYSRNEKQEAIVPVISLWWLAYVALLSCDMALIGVNVNSFVTAWTCAEVILKSSSLRLQKHVMM